MTQYTHVSIEGSEYVPIAGATVTGPSGREERIQVTVVVHSRTPTPALHQDRTLANLLPRDRNHSTREEFETRFQGRTRTIFGKSKILRARADSRSWKRRLQGIALCSRVPPVVSAKPLALKWSNMNTNVAAIVA